MSKIILNNEEFNLSSYNKNTYYTGEVISSTGSCQLTDADIDTLNTMAQGKITSIQIVNDNNQTVYDLNDIDAKIDSINEYYSGMSMSITLNMTFSMT